MTKSRANRIRGLCATLVILGAGSLALSGCTTATARSTTPQLTEGIPAEMTTPPAEAAEQPGGTPIRITVGDDIVTGVLWDNAAARSLTEQLPLTLTFRDFNRVEKISRVPQPLSMEGMPKGDDPEPNDIGYYAPSGDLVLYYGDVGYWNGIARIGEFTSSLDPIQYQEEAFTATIELAP
ncbi:cyclophilin-like fold protein [Microbacterium pumilum]|uniref:Cyclophilin-like domain-containing protein n=1 Tax=Microbacterium pumilum TaxID=344165 RepID=A0ABP5DHS5_9MICO